MGQDRRETHLGNGILYLNNVDVGFMDESTTLVYTGEAVDFMPGNKQGSVRRFKASESCQLTASLAQINAANMRLAMGQNTALTSSSSFPSYDPSSYSAAASSSWDINHFGGDKSVEEVSLRFQVTTPEDDQGDTWAIVLVLYQVVSNFSLNIPFNRTTISFHDVVFDAQIMPARTAGDQMGFIAKQVQAAG